MSSSSKFVGLATLIALIFVHLTLVCTITITASALSNNATGDSPAPKSNATQSPTAPPQLTTTTATITTTTTTTTAPTTATSTTPEPPAQSTLREPNEQEISEARKIIHEIASTMKLGGGRAALNKPTANQLQDFAPGSPEARVADAATQFGVNFINSLPDGPRENVVVSPVSLQILLNIILLGSQDQSPTQIELAKALGYESNGLFTEINKSTSDNSTSSVDQQEMRTRPHAAMHSLLESIALATHLTTDEQHQQQLLNSNPQLTAVLHTTARDIGSSLTSQVNFTLANLMLTNEDLVRTDANYETDLKRFYDVKLENFSRSNPANASNETSDSRPLHERVNGWVQNITKNQINELVSKDDLDGDDLALVLLNAAHFKGRWLHTFNAKMTQERLFYNQGQESGGQEVKFMRQNGVFGYAEFGGGQTTSASGEPSLAGQQTSTSDETVLTEDSTTGRDNDKTSEPPAPPVIELSKEEAKRFELTSNLNCSALMLPFALNDGQELSMMILLPNKRDGLRGLMANLNGPALNEVYRSLNEQHVQVEIPKFTFESSLDAKTTLEKMGLTRIFRAGSDLARMLSDDSPKNVTKVDKVVHKAKIAVDELGAEAAAASAATIVLRNLIRPPNPSFVADHPFLFVIRHNRSNLPLFMGTIHKL